MAAVTFCADFLVDGAGQEASARRYNSVMRLIIVLAVLALTAACQNTEPSEPALSPPAKAASVAGADTDTNLNNLDLSDTVEQASSAVPGEELARAVGAVALGQSAPITTMKTIDGQVIDLANLYGKKPVYIKFWATWCVPCRQQMPAFQKTFQTLGDRINVIAVDIGLSDDEASVRKVRDFYKLTMPIVIDDGHLAQLFGLRVTPQHVLIGKDARFAYFGHAENQQLADAIDRVLSQRVGGRAQAATAATAATAAQVFAPGDMVPAMFAKTTTGKEVSLQGSASGRIRAVEFFSSWCEWYLEKTRPVTSQACARVRQDIEVLAKEVNNVDWLGIAGGPWATTDDLTDYQQKHGVTMPVGLDAEGKLFRAFGVRDIPTIALIDAHGKVLRMIGPRTTNLKAAVHAVADGI